MKFSSRALGVSESETLRLSNLAARLRAEGRDIVGFLEGEPDLPVPEPVIRATAAALAAGKTRYSASTGLAELKTAIVKKLRDENGVAASVEGVVVTNGAKQAVYETLQALCGPGDEVLIPAPCWVTFPEAVKLSGATPVLVPTDERNQLDLDRISNAITAKTKAIIINTPNNPTGAVYPKADLQALLALASKHGFVVIADEAYEALVYDGIQCPSVGSLPTDAQVITLQTCSKSFAMTGHRVGWLAGPPELARAVARIHGHVTGNVATFVQHGAIAALSLGETHRTAWRAVHQKRRDAAYAAASKLFDCVKPQGGLFVFADARRHLGAKHKDSSALAAHFLETAGVAVVPGSAFGREGFLRLSFSAPEATILEGYKRLAGAL